ncbi:MAG: HDIG domain-containing protein, partial [Clostridiales bacterium]
IVQKIQIRPNKEYDAVATAAEVERIVQEVPPVQVTIQPGEKIVSQGSVVTDQQIETLQFLGMLSHTSPLWQYLGVFLFLLMIYSLLIFYLRSYYPKTKGKEANIVLIGMIINLTLFLCKLISMITISDKVELAAQIGFLLPVSAASMLLTVLLGRGEAIFITVFLGILIGILMGGNLATATVAIVGGMVGIFQTTSVNQRGQFVGASFYIALANVLTILSWGLMNGQTYPILGVGVLLGILNGIFASILTIGLLPFLERAFGVTTMVSLLELSNTNHPILKRLMMEAPGTYHHSVLVGNLAEAAAVEVGANPLLVRVASYYHDVGKLKRPYFYIENQINGDNPHDKLQPTLSSLILASHVKDG